MQVVPKISVAICTHNRAKYLAKALDSLCAQTLSITEFEVLVIDNASRDSTTSVVDSTKRKLANLRYVFEPELGLSIARNRALAEVSTKYISFLDDDAIASPQWIEKILNSFESIKPTPAVVGGRVEPIWEGKRPEWLAEGLIPLLTIVDWFQEPQALDPFQHYIAGANMAFVTTLLRDAGGFDSALGRIGNRLLSGEEILAQRLLSKSGHSVYYDPSASVKHHVPAARLHRSWFLERMFWQGVSDAVITIKLGNPPVIKRVGLALKAFLGFARRPGAWTTLGLSSANAAQLLDRCRGRQRLGRAMGLLCYSNKT